MKKKLPLRRRAFVVLCKTGMYFAAGITAALLVFLIGYIFVKGLPNITWELLTTASSTLKGTTGILPNLVNTLYIIVLTLIVVLPLGVGAAVYLTEYARNKRLVNLISFATETLAGIPSILYGLVGMLFFTELCGLKSCLLAGALTLAIMTLPMIIRTTQESLKTVPQSYREGALGLGAGKWHMIRTVVLPASVDGIVTGCILTVGRIVGESAALLFTTGMSNALLAPWEAVLPNRAGTTLTVAMYKFAKERGQFDVAFAIAAILLILTLLINLAAQSAGKKLKK